jgi:hypothetical protein
VAVLCPRCVQKVRVKSRKCLGENGRHVGTRTPDLYRVNFEVSNPKPFPYLAFPRSKTQRTPSEIPSFDGELMASSRLLRPAGSRLLDRGRDTT